MFFHVILTNECDMQCKYCYGEALEDMDTDFYSSDIEYSLPKKMNYSIGSLDKFCRQDPECVLTFYGGEPLLCIDEIKRVMDNVKAKHFMIQTNGLHLKELEPEYINRFHTILVSLDGDEALTDYYRGEGCFKRAIENLKWIKQNGFSGELIARMTVMEHTDIYKQVKWLFANGEFSFSSVHWQLNAGFWNNDLTSRDFKKWSEEDYNPGIRKLTTFWIDYMESNSAVLRLYPLLGIAQSLLLNKTENLRCGGGWINYAIQTDGHIIPCPTMWGMKSYYIGHILDANPMKLMKVFVGIPCTQCEVFSVCGGRCLYANVTRRWNAEEYGLVCNTVRNLIQAVSEELPRIKQLVDNRKIRLRDFEFTKYNGCEIIP